MLDIKNKFFYKEQLSYSEAKVLTGNDQSSSMGEFLFLLYGDRSAHGLKSMFFEKSRGQPEAHGFFNFIDPFLQCEKRSPHTHG